MIMNGVFIRQKIKRRNDFMEPKTLEENEKACKVCEKCELCKTRTKVVFGVGKPTPTLMFNGEAPGQ